MRDAVHDQPLPLVVAGAGAGAGAEPDEPDEPDDRDELDDWLGAATVIVCTTGFAVSWTGAAGTTVDAAVSAATAAIAASGAVSGLATGIRWMTTCTGGAAGAGSTGATVVSVDAGSVAPLTGLSSPRTVTMPNIAVAPRPAATMRLPWATWRRRRLGRFAPTVADSSSAVADAPAAVAAAAARRARSCATRSSWSTLPVVGSVVGAAFGVLDGSPIGNANCRSVIIFTTLVLVVIVVVVVVVVVLVVVVVVTR